MRPRPSALSKRRTLLSLNEDPEGSWFTIQQDKGKYTSFRKEDLTDLHKRKKLVYLF